MFIGNQWEQLQREPAKAQKNRKNRIILVTNTVKEVLRAATEADAMSVRDSESERKANA